MENLKAEILGAVATLIVTVLTIILRNFTQKIKAHESALEGKEEQQIKDDLKKMPLAVRPSDKTAEKLAKAATAKRASIAPKKED